MSRYIDADKIPWTDLNDNQNSNIKVLVTFAEKVNRMPTADVRENVRGKWILTGEIVEIRAEVTKCSVCGCETWGGGRFCCGCGAYMRGDNNEL